MVIRSHAAFGSHRLGWGIPLSGGQAYCTFFAPYRKRGRWCRLAVLFDAEAGNGLASLGNTVPTWVHFFFDAMLMTAAIFRVFCGAVKLQKYGGRVGCRKLRAAVRMDSNELPPMLCGNSVASRLQEKSSRGQNQHMIAECPRPLSRR